MCSSSIGMAAASSSHGPNSSSSPPCAGCKYLRKKCTPECIFAPYFPPNQRQKFSNVHKVFGASNVAKILRDLLPESRQDAVSSLVFEADARMQEPVCGCVGGISHTQQRISVLKTEIKVLQEEIEKLKLRGIKVPGTEALGLQCESVVLGTGDGVLSERVDT